MKPAEIVKRAASLHEANPMLGHRGCRLSITYPEILEMQVRAIVEAAINCAGKKIKAQPEIMIPLVGTVAELETLRQRVETTIEETKAAKKFNGKLDILIGTMIEIPRAALTADEIAAEADFFSFGTNDLTQLTFGYSRDDVNTFLPDYLSQDILHVDPFQSLDQTGVGQLVETGVKKGRSTKAQVEGRDLRGTRREIPPRLISVTVSDSTTSVAAPSASRSLAWRRLRLPCGRRSKPLDQRLEEATGTVSAGNCPGHL